MKWFSAFLLAFCACLGLGQGLNRGVANSLYYPLSTTVKQVLPPSGFQGNGTGTLAIPQLSKLAIYQNGLGKYTWNYDYSKSPNNPVATPIQITNVTAATPIVITTASAHNFVDGSIVQIQNVGGITAANGFFVVKRTGYSANTYALYSDYALSTAVAGSGTYTSGTGTSTPVAVFYCSPVNLDSAALANQYAGSTTALGVAVTSNSVQRPTTLTQAYTNASNNYAALGNKARIVCLPGEYFKGETPGPNSYQALNIDWVGYAPGVKLTGWFQPSSLTWSSDTGSIYKCSRSGVQYVVDQSNLSSNGDFKILNQVLNHASMTAGTYFMDTSGAYGTANTCYVWLSDSRAISTNDTTVRLSANTTTWTFSGPYNYYLQDLEFQGCGQYSGGTAGIYFLDASGVPTATVVNCVSRYGPFNGIGALGGVVTCINCSTSSNSQDGFNYHCSSGVAGAGSTHLALFLELGCNSTLNGNGYPTGAPGNSGSSTYWTQLAQSQNASTAHDGCRGIRVGCNYGPTYGAMLADVSGVQSWSLGCTVTGPSLAATTNWSVGADNLGYSTQQTQMWIEGCTITAGTYTCIQSGGGATIFTRNNTLSGKTLFASGLNGNTAGYCYIY